MIDPKSEGNDPAPAPAPKRAGHRAIDVKDAVAEMTERAKEISQEAGTTMAAAMKELIAAAAGLAGFAIESARDLVQFMVRRGQMTQEEADKLLKEVEAAHPKKKVAAASAGKGASMNSSKPSSSAGGKTARPPAAAKKSENKAAKSPAHAPAAAPAKAAAKKAPAKKAPAKKTASTPKAKKAPAAKK